MPIDNERIAYLAKQILDEATPESDALSNTIVDALNARSGMRFGDILLAFAHCTAVTIMATSQEQRCDVDEVHHTHAALLAIFLADLKKTGIPCSTAVGQIH